MTTYDPAPPAGDVILAHLGLAPSGVPNLPAKARTSLIAFLLRWQYYDAAERCLQQLLISHSHLVTIYDSAARLYLTMDDPDRAVEIMMRRHRLGASNSSTALEARAHLAAGDAATAREIAERLVDEQPDLLTAWALLAHVRLEIADLDGAEAAWRQWEKRQPGAAVTALGIARIWQARGDREKALLWARTAESRYQRDERPPSADLMRLLLALYQETGQSAQATATTSALNERRALDLERVRQLMDPDYVEEIETDATETISPATPAAAAVEVDPHIPEEPRPATEAPEAGPEQEPVEFDYSSDVITGAVELTSEEQALLEGALREHFDHNAFRPGQADVIATILRGESALAVMPTGFGKSLCYQLAALLLPGTTLVISPLIALMKDQIDGLPADVAGMSTTLNSTLEGRELEARMARAAAGGYKLLYAAPERLRQRPFLHALKQAGVSLLVVDEAHCVSLWGHDFRPDYHFISKAWRELGEPTILAMTATATPRVRDDIQTALVPMRLVAVDVHRPNLRLEARRMAVDRDKQEAVVSLCREMKGNGIVYINSREKCEKMASLLNRRGVPAIHYHAGMRDRAAAQDRFMSGQVRVVVATIAFGMGVDKADVRFIIHYSPPKALENYYQEAGRAGRDGLPARCILFHSVSDKANLTRWTRQGALDVEFLRRTYAAVHNRAGGEAVALLALSDLERDLGADSTKVRVAVHFLENAGLLWRGFDLPRTASLNLRQAPDGRDPGYDRFVEAARLRPRQTVSRNLLSLSQQAGLDARTVETELLAWAGQGWLEYKGIGRDMLVALPKAPPDSSQRITAMLAEYQAGQDGRIGEIMSYANTSRCRHGHISAYFGGRPMNRCEACDNCLGLVVRQPPARRATPRAHPAGPAPGPVDDPARTILEGAAQLPYPVGRRSLMRALQGARTSPFGPERFPAFGSMGAYTQKQIDLALMDLIRQGYLEYFQKNDYTLLRLTDQGHSYLRGEVSAAPAGIVIEPRAKTKQSPRSQASGDVIEGRIVDVPVYDKGLFQALRAWRLEQAREAKVPPYVVFSDATLKAIAAAQPATLRELDAVKGVGPKKLEQYGQDVLDTIAGSRSE